MQSSQTGSSLYTSHGRKFTICPVRPGPDQADIFAFMQNQFRVQEPITSAIKCSARDTFHFYRDICSNCFKHDFSLIARDGQGQLAGIVLNSFWQRNEEEAEEGEGKNSNNKGEKGRKEFGQAIRQGPYGLGNANRLAIFLDWVEPDLHSLLPPSARRVLKLDILAVHPIFLRLGLASHLVEKSVQIARSARCSHIATSATAVASQTLFRKFGFQTTRRVQFDEFLEDGMPVYRNLYDNGTGAELMVLEL